MTTSPLSAVFTAMRAVWRRPFVRFLVVGAGNTAFGWGCYALLIAVGLPRPPALLLATILGVLFNYQSTGRVVFSGAPAGLLPRFVAVYAGVYLFNLALLELACRGLGVGSLAGQLLALPPTVLVSFIALRALVFRRVVPGVSQDATSLPSRSASPAAPSR